MSDRRRLRRAGERLIVKAFGRCKEGSVNIISAPTGTGKTYNIQHSLIPSEIKIGKTHFLYLTVYTDSVAQEYYDFTKSLFGKARVTKDLQEFLNWDYEETGIPIVLISTIQGAVNGGTDNNNNKIIVNYLKDLEFTVMSSSILGDINGDQNLNVLDVILVVNMALGNTESDLNGDMNGDGMINVLDVVLLVNIILAN